MLQIKRVRTFIFLFFVYIVISSCGLGEAHRISEAKKLVPLSTSDLHVFELLKSQLISNSLINRVGGDTLNLANDNYWFNTIDSVKYSGLLNQLKQPWASRSFAVNRSGQIIFSLKHYFEERSDGWSYAYEHELISTGVGPLPDFSPPTGDILYLDSVIDKNWRYRMYRVHTGH